MYYLGNFILGVLFSATLLFILFSYVDNAAQLPKLFLITFFFGWGLICLAAVILLTLFRIPMSFGSTPPKWKGKLIWVSVVIAVLLSGQSLARSINIEAVTFDAVRIALLIVVLYDLMSRVLHIHRDNPTLQSLVTIRREVALEKITVSDALNQTEIALAGMRAHDVLQEDIRAYLESVGKILAAYHDAIGRIDAVHSELPPGERLSWDKSTVARTILDVCNEKTEKARKEFALMKTHMDKLFSRMKWVRGAGWDERKSIYDAIDNALIDITTRAKEYKEKTILLESRLEPPKT